MREISDDDLIIEYLIGNVESLSKPQEAKLERLYACDDLIRAHGIRDKVINMMVSIFQDKYDSKRSYSKRTAMNDYNSCEYIFGTTYKPNRDYFLSIALRKIEETRQTAKILKNTTAMAACDKNYLMAMEKFMGDKDVPDYKSLQIPDQIFSADPKLLGLAVEADDAKMMAELEKIKNSAKSDALSIGYTDVEVVNG